MKLVGKSVRALLLILIVVAMVPMHAMEEGKGWESVAGGNNVAAAERACCSIAVAQLDGQEEVAIGKPEVLQKKKSGRSDSKEGLDAGLWDAKGGVWQAGEFVSAQDKK